MWREAAVNDKKLEARNDFEVVRHVLELEIIYYIRQPIAMVSANVGRSTENICKRRVWKKMLLAWDDSGSVFVACL